ncbi:MAG: plasmid stabilization protein [Rhodospirillales bacterium]|nr:plasmid stabilization protein [Rhodospirillales bacterium]
MVDLTVRNVSEEVLAALERRAATNGHSVEAEHRELLHAALLGADDDYAARAKALRQRLRSSADCVDTIRAARDGAI